MTHPADYDTFDMVFEYPHRLLVTATRGQMKRLGGSTDSYIKTILAALDRGLSVRYVTKTRAEMDNLLKLLREEQHKQRGTK